MEALGIPSSFNEGNIGTHNYVCLRLYLKISKTFSKSQACVDNQIFSELGIKFR